MIGGRDESLENKKKRSAAMRLSVSQEALHCQALREEEQ